MLKKLMAIAIALGILVSISACNTIQGVGKDVERGGEKVQDAAESVQKKM